MLRGLTALAGGLSYKGQASLSNRPSWESVICVPVRKSAEIRDSRGAAGRQSVVHKELSGNIRKAGLRGSAQESDGRDSTNRIDMAFWHLPLTNGMASNSKKSSRKSLSLRRFQVHFASRCRPPPADKRRKKMFFQPNGKSISWDWNAFRLKKIKKRTLNVKNCI